MEVKTHRAHFDCARETPRCVLPKESGGLPKVMVCSCGRVPLSWYCVVTAVGSELAEVSSTCELATNDQAGVVIVAVEPSYPVGAVTVTDQK